MCYTLIEEDIINDITRQNNDGVVDIDNGNSDTHKVNKISIRMIVEMLNLVETFWLRREVITITS